MVERLELLTTRQDPRANPFLNRRRLAMLREIPTPVAPEARRRHQFSIARESLLAGDSEEAIRELESLLDATKDTADAEGPSRSMLSQWLAIAYLRLAEQENCIRGGNADSCVYPLRDHGIHEHAQASHQAFDAYRDLLETDPDNLTARWLLNVSAMAVDQYPESVPKRWQLPDDILGSDTEVEAFVDRATEAGLVGSGLAGGIVLEDLDGDGDLDLMVSSWHLGDPLQFFSNDGRGTFEDRTHRAGLQGITGGLNLVHGDYDGDGNVDVLLLRGAWLGESGRHPNSLLRNLGDGRFEDVTEEAGLLSFHPTQTASWSDYDRDGDLDLFIGNESLGADSHASEFFQNNGDGTFSERAALLGIATTGYVKGVVWADFNGDTWPDLFVSRFLEPNQLFLSPGTRVGERPFRDVSAEAGVREPIHSFPVSVLDIDDDGRLDLFVADYAPSFLEARSEAVVADLLGLPSPAERSRLFLNRDNGSDIPHFDDVSTAFGLDRVLLAMGMNVEDFDGDGRTDIYVGTGAPDFQSLLPNRLFRNIDGQRFIDVTAEARVGHLQKGHGIAFGDIDRDLDPDLLAVLGGAFEGDTYRNALFENPGGAGRRIVLHFTGTQSNRSALGTKVRLDLETDSGRRSLHRTVGLGGSFGSSSLQLEIGLGAANSLRTLDVSWPSGRRVRVHDLPLDRSFQFFEGPADPKRPHVLAPS